jgi:uncharacterized protein YjbI with pentapeptide repeats
MISLLAIAVLAAPAAAQNAGEIARVQSGQSCAGCNLFQADLSFREIRGVDLSRSRLRQANLQISIMDRTRFDGANLSVANLFGARFTGASFVSANMEDASIVGAYFGGADLRGANLTGANLSGAELAGAHGLTQSQLNRACGDAATQLPPGLTIPPCPTR